MISKQAYHSAENPTYLSCTRSTADIEVVPEHEGSFGWGRQVKGYMWVILFTAKLLILLIVRLGRPSQKGV